MSTHKPGYKHSMRTELLLLAASGVAGFYRATGINPVQTAFKVVRAANQVSKAVNRVMSAAMHKGQM